MKLSTTLIFFLVVLNTLKLLGEEYRLEGWNWIKKEPSSFWESKSTILRKELDYLEITENRDKLVQKLNEKDYILVGEDFLRSNKLPEIKNAQKGRYLYLVRGVSQGEFPAFSLNFWEGNLVVSCLQVGPINEKLSLNKRVFLVSVKEEIKNLYVDIGFIY